MTPVAEPKAAVQEYARLLVKMHELDPRGENESPELDTLCDQLDGYWAPMSGLERTRVRELSKDLYALADGRQGVSMSPEERRQWEEKRESAKISDDPDIQLAFLRQPFPIDIQTGVIQFMQARCWERLANLEVALVFMQNAARNIPTARSAPLVYLEQLGRFREAAELADRLIADAQSTSRELYFAAGTLYLVARRMAQADAHRIYLGIVTPLRKVIDVERRIQIQARKFPWLEASAARALAVTFCELGDRAAAVHVCNDALRQYPNDPLLHYLRGVANLEKDPGVAEVDFEQARSAGIQYSFPYAVLAWFQVQKENYHKVWTLCNEALQYPDAPPEIRAMLHEWRGIAYAELGQPKEWVEEEFRQALALSPSRAEPINHNWRLAKESISARETPRAKLHREWSIPSSATDLRYFGGRSPLGELIPNALRERTRGLDPFDVMAAA